MTRQLKGMTWSHPRGYDPMVACSAIWKREDRRRDRMGQALAAGFRILPGRGTGARLRPDRHRPSACRPDHRAKAALRRSTSPGREAERAALAAASVGKSYPSYNWQGRQWAFPIDAATQVQAWRPDLLAGRAGELGRSARSGAAGQGAAAAAAAAFADDVSSRLPAISARPCATTAGRSDRPRGGQRGVRDDARDRRAGRSRLFRHGPDRRVWRRWRQPARPIACAPLIYGYVSYAIDGLPPAPPGLCRHSRRPAHPARSARRWAAPASPSRHSPRPRMRRSISPTGSPAATSSAVPMPRPAASPAMPRRGRTTPSMRRRATSIEQHARDARRRLGAAAP